MDFLSPEGGAIAAWAAVIIAIFAIAIPLWLSGRKQPRPRWTSNFRREMWGRKEEPRPGLNFTLTNHGNAVATDVKMILHPPGRDAVARARTEVIAPGEKSHVVIGLVTGDFSAEPDLTTRELVPISGDAVRGKYSMEIQWRQAPNASTPKSKRFKFTVE